MLCVARSTSNKMPDVTPAQDSSAVQKIPRRFPETSLMHKDKSSDDDNSKIQQEHLALPDHFTGGGVTFLLDRTSLRNVQKAVVMAVLEPPFVGREWF